MKQKSRNSSKLQLLIVAVFPGIISIFLKSGQWEKNFVNISRIFICDIRTQNLFAGGVLKKNKTYLLTNLLTYLLTYLLTHSMQYGPS